MQILSYIKGAADKVLGLVDTVREVKRFIFSSKKYFLKPNDMAHDFLKFCLRMAYMYRC